MTDRRIQKTQEAIFAAFFDLLNTYSFREISIAKIIETANIGRSTFYTHFSSKDELLFAVTNQLFQHVFEQSSYSEHLSQQKKLEKDGLSELLAHLFQHFKENQNKITTLFKLEDEYFFRNLDEQLHRYVVPLVQPHYIATASIPDSLNTHHITATFVTCLNWWLKQPEDIPAQTISQYYLELLS